MFRIDQTGLSTGVIGQARTDGLITGAQVTLTYAGFGTFRPRFLWVPPGDTGSLSTLALVSPGVWRFTPTAGLPGTYRIEGIENEGLSTERRRTLIFRTRDANGFTLPAFGEKFNPLASLVNASNQHVELAEDNATDYPNADLAALPWAGGLRVWLELIQRLATESIPHQWRTILNVDFTTQTTNWPNTSNPKQFTADGQYFLDDLETALYFANHANLYNVSGHWLITPGTGLILRPNAAVATFLARTAPYLYTRLGSVIEAPLRARVRLGSNYLDTGNYVWLSVALGWSTQGGTFYAHEAMARVNDGETGITGVMARRSDLANSSSTLNTQSWSADPHDVVGLLEPEGPRPLRPFVAMAGKVSSGAMLPGANGTDALHELQRNEVSTIADARDALGTDGRAGYCYLMLSPNFSAPDAPGVQMVIRELLVEQWR